MYLKNDRTKDNVNISMRLAIKCFVNLFLTLGFYFVCTEISRYYLFEDVSRKLCNLSFIFFIMSTGLVIWSMNLLVVLIVTKIIIYFVEKSEMRSFHNELNDLICNKNLYNLLDRSCSFFEVVDAKFIGISIFMVSNYFTGIINLTMITREQSPLVGYFCIILNGILSTFLPFFVFNYYQNKSSESQKKKKSITI